MQSVVASFILAKHADGRAPRTIQDYHRCLDPFASWCAAQPLTLGNLARSDVRRYVVKLRSNGWSESTVGIHIRNLRTFLRWCHDEGLANENLALAISAPRMRRREELPLSHAEIKLLVSACSDSSWAERDRALILFLLDTGMRVGEMVLVKRADLHLNLNSSTGWLWVYGPKTRKHRFVILGQRTLATLLKYLEARGENDGIPELWIGRKGALTDRGVSHALKRLARAVGLEKRVHPHIFRKTFATNWLDNKGDPERLRVLMGWSAETLALMLTIYIASKRTHLEIAHAIASPVDNLAW